MPQPMILPVTENWNEGERDWSYVKDARAGIADWEARAGKTLPDDYRRFMLKFNGGRLYPSLLRHNVTHYSSEPTLLEYFYSWDEVIRHANKEVYFSGTPEGFLIIGGDPGGLEILLSCRDEDQGQIFCWYHTTVPWGTDDNAQVWHQAGSFSELLASLYEDESKTSHQHWYIPLCDSLAQPLEF
ncbi:MAG: SMI1/KNR4 family protein [Pseudomonadota bacterium]